MENRLKLLKFIINNKKPFTKEINLRENDVYLITLEKR